MSVSMRSNHGCWTCRLRKKKCDETKPSCSLCKSLSLSCHGYGPKPEWMDGGVRENETAAKIRHHVKQETVRRRRLRIEEKRRLDRLQERAKVEGSEKAAENLDERINGETGSATTLSSVTLRDNSVEATGSINSVYLQEHFHRPKHRNSSQSSQSSTNTSSPQNPENRLVSAKIIDEEEEGLLMHYLDYVFPLQFRFYEASPSNGGRGWLLSILLRTKPLYYTAITLAAYHRESMSCRKDSRVKCSLDGLLSRYNVAIKELRLFIEGFGTGSLPETLPELIALLACMTLLISLEIIHGGTGNWQMHLEAAISLIPVLRTKHMAFAHQNLSPFHKSALSFFAGVISWYDILSCATTRANPFTMDHCLAPGQGHVHLDKLMGCENWTMLIIMDIAALNEKKIASPANGEANMHELAVQGAEIERRLEEGLRRTTTDCHKSKAVQDITRIFACSAFVYLNVVVSGGHSQLSKVQSAVCRTIEAFQNLSDPALMCDLTWPFCIAGCMASDEQEDFFRAIALPKCGRSYKALEVAEECWRLRKLNVLGAGIVDWNTAMDSLGLNILLV